MRLRLATTLLILCAPLAASSAWAAGPAAPLPDEAPIRLTNHRAVYDLSLAKSEGTRAVEACAGASSSTSPAMPVAASRCRPGR